MASDPPCVFCSIISGVIEASLVHQDTRVTVFMDIYPITPGHLLVVPNEHVPDLAALDDNGGAAIFASARRMAAGLRRTDLGCEGITLLLADGEAAGQDVFHCHLHVIPRYPEDGFGFRLPSGFGRATRDALDEHARMISSTLESHSSRQSL